MAKVNPVVFVQVPVEKAEEMKGAKETVGLKNEKTDSFDVSKHADPKVNTMRAIVGYLSQAEIDEINKTRKLPKNVKISRNVQTGNFYIVPNWFNITRGTHTVPQGYELRKNLLGFTEVVPIDEEGLTLRKK